MFRIAICEDEKVILEYESSLVNQWGKARGCALELDEYVSAEQFLFDLGFRQLRVRIHGNIARIELSPSDFDHFMEEKVKNFSSGMVSRLGFAIATAGGAAEILILDEVLSVGDEFFRKKSLARIQEMIHGGSTVLMVSHNMNTIRQNCSKVVWIEKGDVQMIGRPDDVCAAYSKMHV